MTDNNPENQPGPGYSGQGFRLKNHRHYLEVITSGTLVKNTILSSLGELLKHPEYPAKPSLWNLYQSTPGFSMADLSEIVGILRQSPCNHPERLKKTVILVQGQFHASMAGLFTGMARDLPYHWQVSTTMGEAEAFLSP
ncbi:MAG: hypothetical protein HUN04_06265 [Desulfobacter sp.]|nr:MAG: hypothetical protein HUN04_06265 [Desulfobacter sp.]